MSDAPMSIWTLQWCQHLESLTRPCHAAPKGWAWKGGVRLPGLWFRFSDKSFAIGPNAPSPDRQGRSLGLCEAVGGCLDPCLSRGKKGNSRLDTELQA